MAFELEDKLLLHINEAAKVLHMDQSHTATREKIQQQLMTDHRTQNPDAGYYDYPTVQDTYGDASSGQVVFAQNGKHTMANYKTDGKKVAMSGHKPVKKAYVTVSDNDGDEGKVKESSQVYVDGTEYNLTESLVDTSDDIIPLKEAFLDKDGNGRICVIKPGAGDKGWYTVDAIKKAVKDKIFHKGLPMHIDHQTSVQEAEQPEGSIKTMAAKYTDDASWDDNGPEGPAAYAPINVYPEFRPFIEARAADIGASIAAYGRKSGKTHVSNGRVLPEVSEFVKAKRNDFVTKAGAGGKLLPLYESYRGDPDNTRPQPQGDSDMAQIDDKELLRLQESAAQVPGLKTRIDRYDERFARLDARDFVDLKLNESKLPARSQQRLRTQLLSDSAVIPMTTAGKVDTVKLAESIKGVIEEEAAYLKECGVTSVVRLPSGGAQKAEPNEPTADDALLKESAAGINSAIAKLSRAPKKEEATKVA